MLFYEVSMDGRLQARMLEGLYVIINPPFYDAQAYVDMILKSFDANSNTRALLILPYRPNLRWQKTLAAHPSVHLVRFYSRALPIFSRSNKNNVLKEKG